jgi:hypothetical protein
MQDADAEQVPLLYGLGYCLGKVGRYLWSCREVVKLEDDRFADACKIGGWIYVVVAGFGGNGSV